jgi:hypothetical protein
MDQSSGQTEVIDIMRGRRWVKRSILFLPMLVVVMALYIFGYFGYRKQCEQKITAAFTMPAWLCPTPNSAQVFVESRKRLREEIKRDSPFRYLIYAPLLRRNTTTAALYES